MQRRKAILGMGVFAASTLLTPLGQLAEKTEQRVLRMRRVEIQRSGHFLPATFDQIKSGDHFRLYDDDPAGHEHGEINLATTDAVPCNPVGNWYVMAHPADV